MFKFKHLTFRYIFNRMLELIYQKSNQDAPWLTRSSINFLSSYLSKEDIGFEFGSGRSTIWLAKRVKTLYSQEHDNKWFNKVNYLIKFNNLSNVFYNLHGYSQEVNDTSDAFNEDYVRSLVSIKDNSLDFVLVDGVYRSICALQSLSKIKPGGILIIDNINWYLPSKSYSPASVKLGQKPASPFWEMFLKNTEGWRVFWTSSGVTDTAIFFKPHVNYL